MMQSGYPCSSLPGLLPGLRTGEVATIASFTGRFSFSEVPDQVKEGKSHNEDSEGWLHVS